jgi:lipoprotein-anchoring transpeptidase ErfK/SrfK
MKRLATVAFLTAALSVLAGSATAHSVGAAVRDDVVTAFPAAGTLVVRSVPVRRDASPEAKSFKTMHDFRSDFRPQEILAVEGKTGTDGKTWYRISVPMRPNGTYGWIPASAASLKPTMSQIVVDRSARTIDVYHRGKHALHAKVAVGAPGTETPLGDFYVTVTFVPQNNPFLGVYALETSAYSKLTEWPGGGLVGIHGTNQPWLLGKAVSHGCIRVSNATARQLKRLAPLGTPIAVKA